MKILEQGTKIEWKDKKYITKCKNCGCKFAYENKDTYGFDRNFIKCPQCQTRKEISYFECFRKKYRGEMNDDNC